jgi:hypothetical protein
MGQLLPDGETMQSPSNEPIIKPGNKNIVIIVGLVAAVLCACLLIACALGVVAFNYVSNNMETTLPILPTFEPLVSSTPTPPIEINRTPADNISRDTLQTLQNAVIPENDPYELACRLQGICNIPTTLPAPAAPFQVGDKQTFWIANANTDENFQIEATLLYVTPHTYFWAENPDNVNKRDLKALMETFENEIYPTDREFFGSEWTPGVDNDPHIYVIYASNIGSSVGGYFSAYDSYNPAVREFSNGHETYVLGTSTDIGADYAYSTLAHEFVHMIQFASDNNDSSWLDEGFADLGAFINGYGTGGADWLYTMQPDLQLNDWADANSPDFAAHYGESFLYLAYFLDRFGETATKILAANTENDLTSVDGTLADLNVTDPVTGKIVTADDVFMDWAAAMFLLDGSVGDGRYTYHNYPDVPQTDFTEIVYDCPSGKMDRNVHQYGIDYIGIECAGNTTLHFEGSTVTSLLPVEVHSGKFAFWSNKGNNSDMTLTREFDFTNASAPITLAYSTWYDIEENWDYLFLEVSEDGQHWEIVKTPSGTDYNPQGNAYGWGYTGQTNGWIEESVDLSAYAGKKIQARFEYITDPNVYGEGFLLDNIKVDAIGYAEDFENGDGGWDAQGFVRVDNALPQTFRLMLIIDHNGEYTIQNIEVSADQVADIPLSLENGDTATLIVTGVTRFTRGLANYSIEIK